MIEKRISVLMTEREDLIDQWRTTKGSDKAKLLVKIMDLDEYIEKVIKEEKANERKKLH